MPCKPTSSGYATADSESKDCEIVSYYIIANHYSIEYNKMFNIIYFDMIYVNVFMKL